MVVGSEQCVKNLVTLCSRQNYNITDDMNPPRSIGKFDLKKCRAKNYTYGSKKLPVHIELVNGRHVCKKPCELKFGDVRFQLHKDDFRQKLRETIEGSVGKLNELSQQDMERLQKVPDYVSIKAYFVLGGTGFGKTNWALSKLGNERWVYTAPSKLMCDQMKEKNHAGIVVETFQKAGNQTAEGIIIDECFAFPTERIALLTENYKKVILIGDWSPNAHKSSQLVVKDGEGAQWEWTDQYKEYTHWCTQAKRFAKWYGDKICKEFYSQENWSGAESSKTTIVEYKNITSWAEAQQWADDQTREKTQRITFTRREADSNDLWKTQKECQGLTFERVILWSEQPYSKSASTCVALTRHTKHLTILSPHKNWARWTNVAPVLEFQSTETIPKFEYSPMNNERIATAINRIDEQGYFKTTSPASAEDKYLWIANAVKKQIGEVKNYFEFTLDEARLGRAFGSSQIHGWNRKVNGSKQNFRDLAKSWTEAEWNKIYANQAQFEKDGASADALFVVDAPLSPVHLKNNPKTQPKHHLNILHINTLVARLSKFYPRFNLLVKVIDHYNTKGINTLYQKNYATSQDPDVRIFNICPFGKTGNWWERYILVIGCTKEVRWGVATEITPCVANYVQDMEQPTEDYDFHQLVIKQVNSGTKSGEIWQVSDRFVVIPTTCPIYPFTSWREQHRIVRASGERVACVATFHDHEGMGPHQSEVDKFLSKLYFNAKHYIHNNGTATKYNANGEMQANSGKLVEHATLLKKFESRVISVDFAHPDPEIRQVVTMGHLNKPNNVVCFGVPVSKKPIPIAETLIDAPPEFKPIRFAPGEHNAYAACVSRFATNLVTIPRASINAWWALMVFLEEFLHGFTMVEKVGSTLDWIDRFPSNRARSFIRTRWGSVDHYKQACIKQAARKGQQFDENLFMEQARKIYTRTMVGSTKIDRPVNYKMMPKHDEYTVNNVTTKGPRAVCIPANWYLVALGPWTWSFGEMLKSVWHKDNRIVYTAGLSAEELGELLSSHDYWYCGDFSGYDASLRWFHIMFQVIVASRFMPREYVKRLLWRTIDSRIRMPSFRYSGVGRTKSGHPGTSCLNTLLTAWIFFCACKLAGVEEFKLLVSGDDTALAVAPQLFPQVTQNLQLLCNGTGLRLVGDIKHTWDLDYNSQYLYPVDPDKGTKWVLGPKIIRGSKRFVYGYDSPLERSEHIKQLCLAESLNVGFVPILRDHLNILIDQYGIADALGSWMDRRTRVKISAKQHHDLDDQLWSTVSAFRYGKVIRGWQDKEFLILAELEYSDDPYVTDFGDSPHYSDFSGPFF